MRLASGRAVDAVAAAAARAEDMRGGGARVRRSARDRAKAKEEEGRAEDVPKR